MNIAQILSVLASLAPVIEPILLNLEKNNIQPEIQSLIAQVSSPDLKEFLVALDGAISSFVQDEIKKLG